ncbi:conserved protein of unknown function [Mesotoga infera]|uniref:Bacterial repeat domain-containing protein n=1 Tax=Mesotoga infera TaxID=1236046 RepID=A0A7Z7LG44_9BACT|nr:InlB B-repeat-containing protein [Mesotoga infera]SSC13314.1 conserved protein of unknown function [Mesotoga infera]
MARRSRVLLILILFIGLAFLLTGCLKKIDVTLTVAIQGLGETDPDVGAHVFKYGAIVTLTATPAEGYDFEKWEIEGLGSFNESVKEIKLKDSILATAFFAKKSFNIEASVDPENGGIVTGTGSYLFGDTASLTAVAAEGFKFVEWTENGAPIGSDNPLEFVVNANRAFVAHFRQEYTVTVSVTPEEGGTATGGGVYAYGTEATVVATPADCYDFEGWFVDDTLVSEDAEYTFTVTEDVDLVAVFTLKTFEVTVTAEPDEGGVVDGGGTYDCGEEATVTAVADECYDFNGWFVGETLVSEDAEYTFTVTEDVDLVAVFTLKTFGVTVTAEPDEGGVVDGGGTYDCGEEVTVTAVADECYDFEGWFVGETLVSEDAEYTFTAEADVDLVAIFTIKTYVVTSTAGENGAVDPEGETVVDCGDDLLFTFTPDEGYGVDQVTVDGAPVDVVGYPDITDKTYNLEDIRDNHAIDATFKQVFFVTDFDFQAQSPLGNRYDAHIEVDPEVTLLKFSYPDDDTELPVPEAPVVGGVANIVNFFTLDDADFLLIRAFTADGNLLAEIVVELDYSEAFLKVATFTPKREWSLPSAVIYDVHIEVSDNIDRVEFSYPDNPEAEPIPAMAVPVGGVIDIEMNSVDFDAEEITVMAYSGAELLVSKNFDLLKVIEATCEFVADYPILGISEYKFTVVVNSPFCASIEFVADGEIQVIEGNPFAVPGLGTYEFRVFVASVLNRVDVMAKDGADDKIAERNIDLP